MPHPVDSSDLPWSYSSTTAAREFPHAVEKAVEMDHTAGSDSVNTKTQGRED
jgi:hypothetical protein